MGIVSTVVCKTVGVAGMSAVLYDAFALGKANSSRYTQALDADHFEKVHASTRGLDSESQVGSAVQNKVAELRMNNPLIKIFGKTKGFISGALNSLGNNIIPVGFASLALAAKGTFSKIGAWGLAGCAVYSVLREGFGFGKNTPVY